MADLLRYGRFRRVLLWLSDYVPAWMENRMLDFLYPSDLEVTFPEPLRSRE